jgi:cytochrome c peroxidase
MKKFYATGAIVLVMFLAFTLVYGVAAVTPPPPKKAHTLVQEGIDSLQLWYDAEWTPLLQNGDERLLQASFLRGRLLYKRIEWAVEFFYPSTAKDLNGPPLPEIEVEEHIVIPPSGFQVMEEGLFPFEETARGKLLQESRKWRSVLTRLAALWSGTEFRDDQVWAALRLQVLRASALGLSGFDTPLSGSAIAELPASLSSVQQIAALYTHRSHRNILQGAFAPCFAFLKKYRDFNSFDRGTFITTCLRPLSATLLVVQQDLGIQVQNIYAVNLELPQFFEPGAFNANFFAPEESAFLSEEKVALGKALFHDPVLSFSQSVSCASCHRQDLAFTDGLARGRSFGEQPLKRNTPTLLYAGLQQSQFYDMRAGFLEDQVKNVVDNKDEIHGSLEVAAARLSAQDKYVRLFNKAFRNNSDTVTEWQVQVSLAAYVRSLNPFTSRFDQYLRGTGYLYPAEVQGFNLFMGKAKCGTCHFLPLFNGTVPPMFTSSESEVLGVPADTAFTRIDADLGRYEVYRLEELRSAFKTPTVRNIGQTAPYMHNGVFQTLEEVIDFYNEGGAQGRNKVLENQTLPADKLGLTPQEKKALVLFLNTLSDTY